jgi:hypothetical protein
MEPWSYCECAFYCEIHAELEYVGHGNCIDKWIVTIMMFGEGHELRNGRLAEFRLAEIKGEKHRRCISTVVDPVIGLKIEQ